MSLSPEKKSIQIEQFHEEAVSSSDEGCCCHDSLETRQDDPFDVGTPECVVCKRHVRDLESAPFLPTFTFHDPSASTNHLDLSKEEIELLRAPSMGEINFLVRRRSLTANRKRSLEHGDVLSPLPPARSVMSRARSFSVDLDLMDSRIPGRLDNEEPREHLFKVIIVGDATVGKTSFVQRYVQNTFRQDYKSTVGVDFALKILRWSAADTVKLQLWDIAGQERFTWMSRVYYKDAQGCVVMFDLRNRDSFDNCVKWKRDVEAKCCGEDGRPLPCILLANKCDLEEREVAQEEIEELYQNSNFIGWTETSVKDGLMVEDSVRFLVDEMMQRRGKEMPEPPSDPPVLLQREIDDHESPCAC